MTMHVLGFTYLLLISLIDETLQLLVAADPGVFETNLDGEAVYIQRGFSDRSNGPCLFFHLCLEALNTSVDHGFILFCFGCRERV